MWPNSQFPVYLVTFTEVILNGKLHFLYSESKNKPIVTYLLMPPLFLWTHKIKQTLTWIYENRKETLIRHLKLFPTSLSSAPANLFFMMNFQKMVKLDIPIYTSYLFCCEVKCGWCIKKKCYPRQILEVRDQRSSVE